MSPGRSIDGEIAMVRFDASDGFNLGGASRATVATPARDLALTIEVAGAARPQPLTLTLTCVAPARAPRGYARALRGDLDLSLWRRRTGCACTHGGACRVGPGTCTSRALDPDIGLVRPQLVDDGRPGPDYLPTFIALRAPD